MLAVREESRVLISVLCWEIGAGDGLLYSGSSWAVACTSKTRNWFSSGVICQRHGSRCICIGGSDIVAGIIARGIWHIGPRLAISIRCASLCAFLHGTGAAAGPSNFFYGSDITILGTIIRNQTVFPNWVKLIRDLVCHNARWGISCQAQRWQ